MNSVSPKINFVADEIRGFYGLWVDRLMFPDESLKAMESFENPDIRALEDAIPAKGSKTWGSISQVEALITENNIKSVDGLKELLVKTFDSQDAENIGAVFDKAFPAYHDFFEKNQNNIRKNLKALENDQNSPEKGYGQELNAIYDGFNISKDKLCTCYLNAFPGKTTGDGRSNPRGNTSVMNYSIVRSATESNYLGDSNILRKKASTPLHETTHSLFYASELKAQLENNPQGNMKKVMETLTRYFELYDDEKKNKRGTAKDNAVATINEAFAVCATGIYNEKTAGTPVKDGDKWYHGFEAANQLAPVMYPIFKKYIASGKRFDEVYFQHLSHGMEYFNEKIHQAEVQNKISELKARLSEKNADFEIKSDAKAISQAHSLNVPQSKPKINALYTQKLSELLITQK